MRLRSFGLLTMAGLAGAGLSAGAGASASAPAGAAEACAPTAAVPGGFLPQVHSATTGVASSPGPAQARVFAIQFHQDLANVATYAIFRQKLACVMETYVRPNLAPAPTPNVVVFNEELGLMTVATGTRGAAARAWGDGAGRGNPALTAQGVPAGAAGAIGLTTAAYAPQIAYYQQRFPGAVSQSSFLLGATDTMARGFVQAMSDLAASYGVYVIGNTDIAPFHESSDPADVAALQDPDLRTAGGVGDTVFVADSPAVHNVAFVWAPGLDCSGGGTPAAPGCSPTAPRPLRNLLAENLKVNLVAEETQFLNITPGPYTPANLAPVVLPGTAGAVRLGIATSLDAFEYLSCGSDNCNGVNPLSRPAEPVDTSLGYCGTDHPNFYMECLNRLGANVLVQPEANGAWAAGQPVWQPLDWMGSSFRAVAFDPGSADWHIQYAVNPFLVGNLLDLPFDGQSAIFHRSGSGVGQHYIGDDRLRAGGPGDEGWTDPPEFAAYAGDQPQFLALAPWVTPFNASGDSRAEDQAINTRLAPGSGVACTGPALPCENGYRETALFADLTGLT